MAIVKALAIGRAQRTRAQDVSHVFAHRLLEPELPEYIRSEKAAKWSH